MKLSQFFISRPIFAAQLDAEDSVAPAETSDNFSVVAIYEVLGGVGQPLKDAAPIKVARIP